MHPNTPKIPRSLLNPAQLALLEEFVGELVEDGHFIGDRAELADLVQSIAEEQLEYGNFVRAYEIFKLSPDGFFELTFEQFKAQYPTA
jgi:hypothetical protein